MSKRLRLLHIEDSDHDAALLRRHLVRAGFDLEISRVETGPEMEAALTLEPWDLIIADYRLPRFSAPAALDLLKAKGLDLPFIILSGAIGEEPAVAAMRAGAHDYLMKDNLARLVPAIERELQEARNRRDRRQAEEALRDSEAQLAGQKLVLEMIASGAPLHEVLECVAMYVDGLSEDAVCVIMLLDQSASSLEAAAAPGLPAPLRQAVVGMRIPYVMFLPYIHGTRMVVQSLETEPAVWEEYRTLFRHVGIRAGWGTSVIGTHGEMLGIVCAVARREYSPTPRDWNLMETAAHLCAIAIERSVADEARQIKLDALVRHMAEGVVAVDADHRVLLANTAALRMLGMSGPVVGCLLQESGLPGVLVEPLRTELAKRQGERSVLTFALGEIHLQADVSAVRSEHGRAYGAIALLKDVTAEMRFRRLQESFVANVSHELRGPIAALSASLEAVRDGVVPAAGQGRYLSAALAELQRLGRLTFDLLELSRLDAGAVQLALHPFELAPLFERLHALWAQQCEAAGLDLEVHCPSLSVVGDSDRAEQVTANLLENAVRFTPSGGTIRVQAEAVGRMVRITVADTGIGIPREHLPYVWERFYKVDSARTRSERHGTGLGLSIVRHLVERMGGTVTVDSEPGRGSSFRFTLPRAY